MGFLKKINFPLFPSLFALLLGLTPLIALPGISSPYTVPKALFFFLTVEFTAMLWLWKHSSFPAQSALHDLKSPFLIGLFTFLSTQILTAFTGVSLWRSFFGTPTRMYGIFLQIHLVFFFFLLSAVLSSLHTWKKLIKISLFTAVLVSFIAFLQAFFEGFLNFRNLPYIISTLGNEAFVGSYLAINFFLALWLWKEETNRFWKRIYIIAPLFFLLAILLTGIRGVFLGMAAGIGILAAHRIFQGLSKDFFRRNLKIIISSLVVIFLLVGAVLYSKFFFIPKQSAFLPIHSALSRITDISFSSATVQTRFILWKTGFKAFLEKPIFGWGTDNFESAFNKHFDPALTRYSSGEAWYDRTHSSVFQVLAENGIIGFLGFLFWWGILFYYARKDIHLLALSGASFVISLFQPEDVTSLALLFFVAALLFFTSKVQPEKAETSEIKLASWKNMIWKTGGTIILIFAVIYNGAYAYGAWMMDTASSKYLQNFEYEKFMKRYEKGYKSARFAPYLQEYSNRDAMVTFLLAAYGRTMPGVPVNFFQFLHEKEIETFPRLAPEEAQTYFYLGRFLKTWATGDPSKSREAESILHTGLSLNPKHQAFYYSLGHLYLDRGDPESTARGIQMLEKAIQLEEKSNVSHFLAGKAYLALGRGKEAATHLARAFELGYYISGTSEVGKLGDVFWEFQYYREYKALYQRAIIFEPQNSFFRINLAKALFRLGELKEAEEQARYAIRLKPELLEIEPELQKILQK